MVKAAKSKRSAEVREVYVAEGRRSNATPVVVAGAVLVGLLLLLIIAVLAPRTGTKPTITTAPQKTTAAYNGSTVVSFTETTLVFADSGGTNREYALSPSLAVTKSGGVGNLADASRAEVTPGRKVHVLVEADVVTAIHIVE